MPQQRTKTQVNRVWVIRAGKGGQAHDLFLDKAVVALADVGLGHLNKLGDSREHFYDAYRSLFPEESRTGSAGVAGKFFRFLHEVAVGDIVVYPDQSKRVNIGVVTGPYTFKKTADFQHQRKVEWRGTIDKADFRIEVVQEMGAARTFFEIKRHPEVFANLIDSASTAQRSEE